MPFALFLPGDGKRFLGFCGFKMTPMAQTLQILTEARKRSSACLVSYSGGKDSLAIADLCCHTFETVVFFNMYIVEGISTVEKMIDYAIKRWGVKVLRYPHWRLNEWLRGGLYCDAVNDLPAKYKLADVYRLVRRETGIDTIVTGFKYSDSFWRKRTMSKNTDQNLISPLVSWNGKDVLAYCKQQNLPVCEITDINLSTEHVLTLWKNHPDDYEKLRKVFKYVDAIVQRYLMFKIGAPRELTFVKAH